MRFARGLLIFSYGLFTIGAQTLLFREFTTAFEGNDISVGVFFGAWFLWIGLGALLVRRWNRLAAALLHHVEFLLLLYLPAFVAQLLLIARVRELAGVASYDLMSVQTLVLWALLVNAPVSLVTGVFFPVACRWIEQTDSFPISRVYVLEAIGSFVGGLGVTALLGGHIPIVRVFFILTLVLAPSVGVAGFRRVGRAHLLHRFGACLSLLLAAACAVGVATGTDEYLTRHLRVMKWTRLLPQASLEGSFSTAQAEYLYGRYRGQWVVLRDGSVCEALPNEEDAGRTAALALCQNPQAKRALVIGSGLALCNRLLKLPQLEEVAWANPDMEYAMWLLQHAPGEFWVSNSRCRPVGAEIRHYLDATKDHFDLVIINLSDLTSSVLNRYCTAEFYEKVKAALRDGGVLSVSVAGGENVMGAELVSLGASAKRTLEQVFSHLVLVPGDQAWLLASDSKDLTDDPAVLRERFAAIEGSEKIFPPAGLLSIYLPDRAAQAMQSYEKVDLPAALLVNRDSHPLTHLYGLLLAARQSGAPLTRLIKLLTASGWTPFAVPLFVFVALRVWTLATARGGTHASSFDSSFLLFSTGWVGIATVLVLMYSYQTHFGSLYLHVGVISSLFMIGLTAGGLVCSVLVRASRGTGILPVDAPDGHGRDTPATGTPNGVTTNEIMLVVVLLAHGLLLAAFALGFTSADLGSRLEHGVFAAAFVLSGFCCGGYWPIAAAQLAAARFDPGAAGSRLETADHLGACLGGLATSLLAIPILGTRTSLLVLVGLLLTNIPAAVAALLRREPTAWMRETPRLRQAGCVLFALVSCVVLCSNLLARAAARSQPTLPEHTVRTLAGDKQTQSTLATLPSSGRRATYFVVTGTEQRPVGYIFSSADFAPEVRGFGGRINLAIHVDPSGKLADFLLVRSNETPSYLDLLRDWLASLKGKPLFDRAPFAGVQAVTGATISSQAVREALETSGRRFAQEVLHGPAPMPVGTAAGSWWDYRPDPTGLYLLGALAAALIATHWGGFRSRIVVLTLTFIIGGLVLNAQYSSEQIATLLSLEAPAARLTGVFLLAVGVPLVVLLFGNLYCGYVCPFGAAQELLGHMLPRRLRPAPPPREMQTARFIKYIVLAVLIVAFCLSRDRSTLVGDPLTSVFCLRSAFSPWLVGVVGLALLGSLFYTRFWCRYLCPVGAFLSLLNHVHLLRRWVPAKWFGRCEFGLTAEDHLDCLSCDRCRLSTAPSSTARAQIGTYAKAGPLVLLAVLGGLLLVSVSFSRFQRVMPAILEEPAPAGATAGQPRAVDAQAIRTLIERHQLSDKKAEYYKQVE